MSLEHLKAKRGMQAGSPEGSFVDVYNQMVDLVGGEQAQRIALAAALAEVDPLAVPTNPNPFSSLNAVAAGGSGAAYTLTFSPTHSALQDGQWFLVRWPHVNPTASTLQVDALTAAPLFHKGVALIEGSLRTDVATLIQYDAGNARFNVHSGVSEEGSFVGSATGHSVTVAGVYDVVTLTQVSNNLGGTIVGGAWRAPGAMDLNVYGVGLVQTLGENGDYALMALNDGTNNFVMKAHSRTSGYAYDGNAYLFGMQPISVTQGDLLSLSFHISGGVPVTINGIYIEIRRV